MRAISSIVKQFMGSAAVVLLCSAEPLMAESFDIGAVRHTPPVLDYEGLSHPLHIGMQAPGVKRARVLAASSGGYRSYEMSAEGDKFAADVPFGDLAVFKYQFQIESADGRFHESAYYTVRQPAGGDREEQISKLSGETPLLEEKAQQLENALFSLKRADPAVLARTKNQDMARALVTLGQKERLVAEAEAALRGDLKALEEKISAAPEGEEAAQGRRLLEEAKSQVLREDEN